MTGIGAIALAALLGMGVRVPRQAVWAWNIWGIWCLAVIAVIAITTSPMVQLFGGPPHVNTWVLFVPARVAARRVGHRCDVRAHRRHTAAAGPLMPKTPSTELRRTFGEIDIYLFDQFLRGRFDRAAHVLDAGCGDGRNLRPAGAGGHLLRHRPRATCG